MMERPYMGKPRRSKTQHLGRHEIDGIPTKTRLKSADSQETRCRVHLERPWSMERGFLLRMPTGGRRLEQDRTRYSQPGIVVEFLHQQLDHVGFKAGIRVGP